MNKNQLQMNDNYLLKIKKKNKEIALIYIIFITSNCSLMILIGIISMKPFIYFCH